MNTKIVLSLLLAIILFVGGVVLFNHFKAEPEVACTLEAMICPDGTAVGRTGPRCEFAACPGSLETFTDEARGISFKYPKEFSTTYIKTTDWPPQVNITGDPFTCTEAGLEIDRAGATVKENIMGHDYCVTKVVEGAAGSIYTQYAYATKKEGKTVIFTFALRAPQCGNYEEVERSACEAERSSFDLDSIVHQIARSLIVQ